jgi:ribosomal protein S18 acetylase RimI-like enzyme
MTESLQEQLTVRPANADDAADVARIYVDSWNTGFGELMPHRNVTAELIGRWQQDLVKPAPHRWWVAELEGVIVGFAGVGPSRDPIDPDLGELDTIAVDPGHWRNRIGRTLMAVALHHLAADGYREAVLWTLASYPRGQKFYQAMGWGLDSGVRDEGRQIRYRRDLIGELTQRS